MQQLRCARLSAVLVAFLAAPAIVLPQAEAMAQRPGTEADADGPIILIAERRTSGAASKKDPLNSGMRGTLNNVFTNSGKYQLVYTFTPFMPVLKQAVLNHQIQISDLEEPLKPASLRKIANALGARTILLFHSTQEKSDIRTDLSIEEASAPDAWRSVVNNSFKTPGSVGHRKLTLDEMVGINVDAIAKAMKVPSHLLEDMHLEVALPAIAAAPEKKPGKENTRSAATNPPANQKSGDTGVAANEAGNVAAVDPGTGQAPPPEVVTPKPVITKAAQKPPKNSVPSPTRGAGQATGATGGSTQAPSKTPRKAPEPLISPLPTPGSNTVPDGAQAFALDPQRTVVKESLTNAARAIRYRQSGDLPSAILYFRRAVDDAPRDVDVRKQLIQAYQDSNEPSLAEAELDRTLKIAVPSSALYKMHGDALYTEGHIQEAAAAYLRALEMDPRDAQVRLAFGDMLSSTGDFAGAIKQFNQAVADAPNSPAPHRKLARAALQKASSDPTQYAVCLDEVKKARSLTAATETKAYLGDYVGLMRIVESRLVDVMDQLDAVYVAYLKGNTNANASVRLIVDMTERTTGISDFLDALPAAAGQDAVHALYQEGSASILSSLTFLKSYIKGGDAQFDQKLKNEKISARHDIADAGKRLLAAKAAVDTK